MTKPIEMTLTRVINAPRELVFKAWTHASQVSKWWGPKGFTAPVCRIDVRPGGKLYIEMKGPDGKSYPSDGEYNEVKEPERLVFTASPLNEKGEPLFKTVDTIIFEDKEGKTKLTLHTSVTDVKPEAAPNIEGQNEGWNQTLDRLVELVSKHTE